MLQKNAFGQIFFSNFMHGVKSAILASTKRGFSQKALASIFLFFVLRSYESFEGLER